MFSYHLHSLARYMSMMTGSYPPIYRPTKLGFETPETSSVRRRPRVSLTSLKALAVVILALLICTLTGTAVLLVRSFVAQTTQAPNSAAVSPVAKTSCGCDASLLLRSDTRLPSTNVTFTAGQHLDRLLDSVVLDLHLRVLAQLTVKAAAQFNSKAAWSLLSVQERRLARQLRPGIVPSIRERHVDKEESGAFSLLFLDPQFLMTLEDDLRLLDSLKQLLPPSDGESHPETNARRDIHRPDSTLTDAGCQVHCLRRRLFPDEGQDFGAHSSRTSVQSRVTKWQDFVKARAEVRDSDALQRYLVSRDASHLLQHYGEVCTAFYRLDLELSLLHWDKKRIPKDVGHQGGRSNKVASSTASTAHTPGPTTSSTN